MRCARTAVIAVANRSIGRRRRRSNYLEAGGVRRSFALSPDGERIAFSAKDASGAPPPIIQRFPSGVFAIDMARGRKVIPLLNSHFFEYGAAFCRTPNGWHSYRMNPEGRRSTCRRSTAVATRYA